jgi:hypothetical protein
MNTELTQPAPMTSEWGRQVGADVAFYNHLRKLSEAEKLQLVFRDTAVDIKQTEEKTPSTYEDIGYSKP